MQNILMKNRARRTTADIVFDCIIMFLGIIMLAIVAYPLYFVILASFANPMKVSAGEVWLFTDEIVTAGYQEVFKTARIWSGYKNTLIYVSLGTVIHLAVTLSAAYTLSRKDLLLRGPIMMLFTITMFFGGGLIPTYLILKDYKMLDTIWVMVLPGCVSVYHLIIARTFFQSTIPSELLDASQIDGCSDFRFFLTIVLPLSSAIIAVIALYNVVNVWNGYMSALIYLRTDSKLPLQLILREILIMNSSSEASASMTSASDKDLYLRRDQLKYCVIVVSTLPLMVIYPFLQKYFNKGVMIGAIKG